jgi:hypothetical protein
LYLSFRHRSTTELILASDSTGNGHHSCYHRFFSQACWSMETLWYMLARLLLATIAPTGLVTLAGNDTLRRKRGLTLDGGGAVWFQRVGHLLAQYPERPWYRRKSEPSFADMLSRLRRVSWEEKTLRVLPKRGMLKMQVVGLLEFARRAG